HATRRRAAQAHTPEHAHDPQPSPHHRTRLLRDPSTRYRCALPVVLRTGEPYPTRGGGGGLRAAPSSALRGPTPPSPATARAPPPPRAPQPRAAPVFLTSRGAPR